jgi:isocitrate/isopropylmalate dehydrogenase
MPHRITLIPGDGARAEIAEATVHVLEATDMEFARGVQQAGFDAAAEHGRTPYVSQHDERCGVGRVSEGSNLSPNTMSGPPDRRCADAHRRERQ